MISLIKGFPETEEILGAEEFAVQSIQKQLTDWMELATPRDEEFKNENRLLEWWRAKRQLTNEDEFFTWQRDIGVIEGNHDALDASMLVEDWLERDNDM